MQWTVDELIARFNALPVGNTQGTITNLCAINPGVVGGISVCLSPEEHAAIYTTKATAVLVSQSFRPKKPIYTATLLGVEDPYGCFRSLWKEAYVENVHARKGIEFPSYIGEKWR